jgi:hypothetical protein
MEWKEFTPANQWFKLKYPPHWSVTEEPGEKPAYVFMDTSDWKGTLRISAFRFPHTGSNGIGDADKLEKILQTMLAEKPGAERLTLGAKNAVQYPTTATGDEGEELVVSVWVTGAKNTLLLCSFTVEAEITGHEEVEAEKENAVYTLATLEVI